MNCLSFIETHPCSCKGNPAAMPGGLFPYFRATAQTTRSSPAWSGWKAACSGHRSRWNEKHPGANLRCILDLKGVQNDTGHDQFCNSFLQHHPTPLVGHRQEKTEKMRSECFGDCHEYKHEGGVMRSNIGQRNGFLSGFAQYYPSFRPRCSVYKRFVPQSNHTVWYPAKHESCRRSLP